MDLNQPPQQQRSASKQDQSEHLHQFILEHQQEVGSQSINKQENVEQIEVFEQTQLQKQEQEQNVNQKEVKVNEEREKQHNLSNKDETQDHKSKIQSQENIRQERTLIEDKSNDLEEDQLNQIERSKDNENQQLFKREEKDMDLSQLKDDIQNQHEQQKEESKGDYLTNNKNNVAQHSDSKRNNSLDKYSVRGTNKKQIVSQTKGNQSPKPYRSTQDQISSQELSNAYKLISVIQKENQQLHLRTQDFILIEKINKLESDLKLKDQENKNLKKEIEYWKKSQKDPLVAQEEKKELEARRKEDYSEKYVLKQKIKELQTTLKDQDEKFTKQYRYYVNIEKEYKELQANRLKMQSPSSSNKKQNSEILLEQLQSPPTQPTNYSSYHKASSQKQLLQKPGTTQQQSELVSKYQPLSSYSVSVERKQGTKQAIKSSSNIKNDQASPQETIEVSSFQTPHKKREIQINSNQNSQNQNTSLNSQRIKKNIIQSSSQKEQQQQKTENKSDNRNLTPDLTALEFNEINFYDLVQRVRVYKKSKQAIERRLNLEITQLQSDLSLQSQENDQIKQQITTKDRQISNLSAQYNILIRQKSNKKDTNTTNSEEYTDNLNLKENNTLETNIISPSPPLRQGRNRAVTNSSNNHKNNQLLLLPLKQTTSLTRSPEKLIFPPIKKFNTNEILEKPHTKQNIIDNRQHSLDQLNPLNSQDKFIIQTKRKSLNNTPFNQSISKKIHEDLISDLITQNVQNYDMASSDQEIQNPQLIETKRRLSSRKNSLGDRKSTIEEREDSFGERKSAIGERKRTIEERKNTIGERRSTNGDVKNGQEGEIRDSSESIKREKKNRVIDSEFSCREVQVGVNGLKDINFSDKNLLQNKECKIISVKILKNDKGIIGIQCEYKTKDNAQIIIGDMHTKNKNNQHTDSNSKQNGEQVSKEKVQQEEQCYCVSQQDDYVRYIQGAIDVQTNQLLTITLITSLNQKHTLGITNSSQISNTIQHFNLDIKENEIPTCIYGSLALEQSKSFNADHKVGDDKQKEVEKQQEWMLTMLGCIVNKRQVEQIGENSKTARIASQSSRRSSDTFSKNRKQSKQIEEGNISEQNQIQVNIDSIQIKRISNTPQSKEQQDHS